MKNMKNELYGNIFGLRLLNTPLVITIFLCYFIFSNSYAALQYYGVGAGANTLGPELALKASFSPWLSFDVVGHYLPLRFAINVDKTHYRADLHMQNAGLVMQFHPFAGAFQLVAGAFYNGNDLKLNASMNGSTIIVEGRSYSTNQIANIHSDVSFEPFAPYVGIGWGSQYRKGLGIAFDLGVLYQGMPHISMIPVYGAGATPAIKQRISQDIQHESEDITSQLKKYGRFYPVVSLSLYFL